MKPRACTCPECAELDLAFPGEGRQLAFEISARPELVEGTANPRPRNRRAAAQPRRERAS